MYTQYPSISTDPAIQPQQPPTVVRPCIASTHLPVYNIIIATPRSRLPEDEESPKTVRHSLSISSNSCTSSSSSSRSSFSSSTPPPSSSARMSKHAQVTQENLLRVAMAAARDEHLDIPPSHLRTVSSASTNSVDSSCLPSIHEEEEEEEEEEG